jgi:predicted phage baseplate assembly protein
VNGLRAFWLRCRFEQRTPEQGLYSHSPRIRRVSAESLGATTWATNAVFHGEEELGVSNGDPAQAFRLSTAPILDLRSGETVEIEEVVNGELVYVPWQRVSDFGDSDRFDRHFSLDTATGEIRLGPAIRQPNGSVRQYGRTPEVGRRIRMSRYRFGGGAQGNVPAGRINVMRSAVPYIDRVVNMAAASGGRDQESLEEAKMRARRDLRAQERAVTVEDYEDLALKADRSVARVKCLTPTTSPSRLPSGMLELLIVPSAAEAVRAGDLTKLQIDPTLARTVQEYLDRYRLLTTTLQVRAPSYVGVKVRAQIVASELVASDLVVERVLDALNGFITPLSLNSAGVENEAIAAIRAAEARQTPWQGWPFGKPLYVAELFALIQQVRGVKHVLNVEISHRPVDLSRERRRQNELEAFADSLVNPQTPTRQLTVIQSPALTTSADTLLCSLEHEIELVTL